MNNKITKIPKFRRFVIQNFPFIEQDFDALTDYGLISKIEEYLNKVIEQTNINSEAVQQLQQYVEHYFDNLDVQEEINNKLDDMAESGELADIIAQYLQLAGVLAFNTVADMQAGTNLVNGSTAKTLGQTNYLDGKGRFYKIRNITNDDVVDGVNIISITADSSNTLIAELIPDEAISAVAKVNALDASNRTEMVVIGDSYSSRSYLASPNKLWCELVAEALNLTLHNYADPGAGFLADGDERASTFFSQINEAASDSSFNNNKVKYVFIYGGVNDLIFYPTSDEKSDYTTAYANTLANARTKFPNAEIYYLGCDSFKTFHKKSMSDTEDITNFWVDQTIKGLDTFKSRKIVSIDLTFFYVLQDNYFTDGISGHPNATAHIEFADAVINGMKSSGNAFTHFAKATPTLPSSQANWELVSTLLGKNMWQVRLTDKMISMDLLTCTHKTGTSDNVSIEFPFGFRVPYSDADDNKYFPPTTFAAAICYSTAHNVGSLTAISNNMFEQTFGWDKIKMYHNWANSSSQYYDIALHLETNI